MGYVLGIDVGSGSARCGVFDKTGKLLASEQHPILTHRPLAKYVEQSSENIWDAICAATRAAVTHAGIDPEMVLGLSYSATCSLVLLDQEYAPLVLSDGEPDWNIVMWMDQRAGEETAICNATGSEVLNNLGGSISVEMQIPKLLWLKRNRPDLWARLGYAADLTDYWAGDRQAPITGRSARLVANGPMMPMPTVGFILSLIRSACRMSWKRPTSRPLRHQSAPWQGVLPPKQRLNWA